MSEYSKQLHYIKNGTQTDIKLYTDKSEASDPALCIADGNATVYAKLGDTTDFNASDLRILHSGTTYAVHKEALPPVGTPLNSFTWAQISQIAQAGLGATYFSVGDCKEITLNGNIGDYLTLSNVKLCVFILHINYPYGNNTDKNIIFGGFKTALENGVDVALVDSLYYKDPGNGIGNGLISFSLNHTWQKTDSSGDGYWGGNGGGWGSTDFRYDILGAVNSAPRHYNELKDNYGIPPYASQETLSNPKSNTLLAALPADLRSNIRVWRRFFSKSTIGDYNDDAISILTHKEVTGGVSGDYSYTYQMKYYADGGSKIKKRHDDQSTEVNWWTCTPYTNSTDFRTITTTGGSYYRGSAVNMALAPAFRI